MSLKINKSTLFYISMISILLVVAVIGTKTEGESIQNLLFTDKNDTFMDFYNSLMYGTTPYEVHPKVIKNIYPPLPNIFYYLVSTLIPRADYDLGSFAIRTTQMGRFIGALYIVISTLLFVFALFKLKKGTLNEQMLLLLVLTFSAPFLYQLERANIILITCSFIMFFLYGYTSSNAIKKHLSFVCLAIAAAIKIYPAIFGFLLLKEKRWKDSVVLSLYGILIFFLPFIFMGGFSKIPNFIDNLLNHAMLTDHFAAYKVSIANLFYIFEKYESLSYLSNYSSIVSSIILFMGIFIIMYADYKEEWKPIALSTALMILVPSFSYIYAMIFISIPLIYFLDKLQTNKMDYCYLSLYIIMLAPFPNKNIGCIESIALFAMLSILLCEGIKLVWQKISMEDRLFFRKKIHYEKQ